MALLVEMGWGGLIQYPWTITWTDISQRVDLGQGVAVTRGASDELSQIQPGTATLRLDNQDGALTPGNSTSPYYPFVRRNTPVRVAVARIPTKSGSAPYPLTRAGDDFSGTRPSSMWTNVYGSAGVTTGRARIPLAPGGSAGMQSAREWSLPGTSLCVRWPTVPSAGGSSAALVNFVLDSVTSGSRIGFSYNVVTGKLRCVNLVGFVDGASVDLTYSAIDHRWLRMRESSGTFYWETSPDGVDWTVQRSLTTPTWAATESLVISLTTSRTGGSGDFTEFDALGATVYPRFYGTVNEFPVTWDGLASKVTVTATDLFKRLNRLPVLGPMIQEEIKREAGLLAYWPLTEASDSTSAGDQSGLGAAPLTVTQAGAGGTLAFAGTAGPPATGEQAVQLTPASATAGKYLTADMGAGWADTFSSAYTSGFVVLEAFFQTTVTGRAVMGVASADGQYQACLSLSASGQIQVEWTDSGGTLAVDAVGGPTGLHSGGAWHHVVWDQRSGEVWVDGALAGYATVAVPTYSAQLVYVGGHRGGRLWSGAIAHAAVYADSPGPPMQDLSHHYYAAMTGYAGETADERVARLARYAGVDSVTVIGSVFDGMASQGPGGAGALAQMQAVADTESGRLYAERDYPGLAFQSRDVRYNPSPASAVFTVDYADVEPGIELADDDQKLCNAVTASRPGGATQRAIASSSVLAFGLYEQQLDVLKMTDSEVMDAAYWLVSRYANPQVELREVPIEAYSMPFYEDILDADISSTFSVYNLPAQAPATSMTVQVEGYTETIRERSHLIQFHTSRALTDSVWILGDSTYSVLDSTTRLAY
jgi:hypothetical protein